MRKVKVKVTGFWQSDEHMLDMVRSYGFGKLEWKNLEFTTGTYDRLIILTRPYFDHFEYDEQKAITFLTEPVVSENNRNHKTSLIAPISLVGWTLTKKATKMLSNQNLRIKKTELISSVTSDLCFLDGHLARLEFIQAFDQVVSSGFDLWGKSYNGDFFHSIRSYLGFLEDKFDALLKYKYHFNCENSFDENYYTEKILDPILAETLCFYDGCSNISTFIDDRSFIRLDIKNIEGSIDTIIRSIESNEWKRRIPFIREQKIRLLTHLNPLNIVWMAINELDILKECSL